MLEKDKAVCLTIRDGAQKIIDITRGFNDANDLKNNDIYFDAVMMNFIVIGEMSNKLSGPFKDQSAHIDWRKISALKNIIAHDYFGIDEEEIWQIIKNKLPVLLANLKEILSKVE